MDRVFVVAGGEWQTSLVKKVRELGFQTVNSNLYEDSPAFAYADFCEVADVLDKEKNLEIAERYHVQGVVTDESDIAIPTVAYVAERLGLPTIGWERAALFTNKYRMRCFCREHGLPTPEFRLCRCADEVADFMNILKKRVIIKPLDSQSSRGVFILEQPGDAEAYFAESARWSSDGQSVIAERFMEGTEFTVDGIVVNGRHYCLAVSQKEHYSHNLSIASELFFSYDNEKYDYNKLREANDRLVNMSDLPFGLTHAEYKYENGEFCLVEIAARGGGTRISSHIVPLLTGIDNYRILIEDVLGRSHTDLPVLPVPKYERCAVLKFLDVPQEGQEVKQILGAEEVRANPHVLELHLEFHEGDRLFSAKDDRSRIGFYIAWGESRQELQNTMKWVEKTLQIL